MLRARNEVTFSKPRCCCSLQSGVDRTTRTVLLHVFQAWRVEARTNRLSILQRKVKLSDNYDFQLAGFVAWVESRRRDVRWDGLINTQMG